MKKKLYFIYWELRYRLLKWHWDISARYSDIDGVALMYHHVTDDSVNTSESCKCTIKGFETSLYAITREGRRFVSVDEMLDIIRNKRNDKFAVVTFDDVPENFFTNAYPFLKQEEIPFILFITTGFIGKTGFLTERQILELNKDQLCTIGAHTLTHPVLRKVSNSWEEITESKKILEDMLGHDVDYMAYPYGRQSSVSRRIKRDAERAGYKCAFGTIQSSLSDKSSNNLFYLPRIVKK